MWTKSPPMLLSAPAGRARCTCRQAEHRLGWGQQAWRASRKEEGAVDQLGVMRVSGVVLALMYLLRWAGVSERWAVLLVPVLSALGVGLWAYANAPISQPETFSYVAAWVAVATSVATAWGFSISAARGRRRRRHVESAPGPAPAARRPPQG